MSRLSKWVASSLGTLALGSVLLTGSSAEAFTCTITGSGGSPSGDVYTCTGIVEGDVITVTDNEFIDPDTLIATAVITVTAINTGSVVLDLSITNDATSTARITHFGLSIEPNATGGSIADAGGAGDVDELTTFDISNFPAVSQVEFCASAGTNCAGGSGDGIQPGETDSFTFTLTGSYTDNQAISLDAFAFKFQGGINGASYEKTGTPVGGSPVAGAPVAGQPVAGTPVAGQVPQPGSLMLVGAALLSALVASAGLRRLRSSRS